MRVMKKKSASLEFENKYKKKLKHPVIGSEQIFDQLKQLCTKNLKSKHSKKFSVFRKKNKYYNLVPIDQVRPEEMF